MTSDNLLLLRSELTTDPLSRDYSGMSDTAAASSLNTANRVVRQQYMMTRRQLHVSFGFIRGVQILETLKAIGQSQDASAPLVREVVAMLYDDVGLDIGHPDAETLLAGWVAAGIVTQAEADTLLALGRATVSRGEELGLGKVGSHHVAAARAD